MENLIEDNEEHRKFVYLPGMCRFYTCHLGALTSERFSERIISVATLLVDVHRINLCHDNIDEIVLLRMSKRFMERARCKEAFTTI